MTQPLTGIASIGLAFPEAALTMETLASLRGVDENKLRVGLGCREMALCPEGTDVETIATLAATRAIERWGKPANDLGLIVERLAWTPEQRFEANATFLRFFQSVRPGGPLVHEE